MLGFLRKKKAAAPASQMQTIEDDFNPLDVSSMIAYLKKQKPDITEKEIAEVFSRLAAPADDLDHLDEDGDLPWGWVTHYKDFIDKTTAEYNHFSNEWFIAKLTGDPREELPALKSFVLYMHDVQRLCDQKGECFGFWCSDYLIGSQKSKCEERLADLETNMDAYVKEYNDRKEHERLMMEFSNSVTKEMLLEQIDLHEEILQTDLYKLYDHPCAKEVLKEKLYFMESEGLIERTKSGRTYLLKIKK